MTPEHAQALLASVGPWTGDAAACEAEACAHWDHIRHPTNGRPWADLEPVWRRTMRVESLSCAVCRTRRGDARWVPPGAFDRAPRQQQLFGGGGAGMFPDGGRPACVPASHHATSTVHTGLAS